MNSTRKSMAVLAVVGCAAVATIVALTYQPSVSSGTNFLESIREQTSIKSTNPVPPFTLDPRYANYMSTFGKNYTTQKETAQR